MKRFLDEILKLSESGRVHRRRTEAKTASFTAEAFLGFNLLKDEKIAVELQNRGMTGRATTSDLNDISVVKRAFANSFSKQKSYLNMELSVQPAADVRLAAMTREELFDEGRRLLDRLRSLGGEEIAATLALTASVTENELLNTAGFDHSYIRTEYHVELILYGEDGEKTAAVNRYSGEFFELDDGELEELVLKHSLRGKRAKVQPGKYDVIFSRQAVGMLLLRLISAADHGNIASGRSRLAGKLGERVFSPVLSVYDCPDLPQAGNCAAFDDEGTPTSRKAVIENGVFKNCLVSMQDAAASGLKPTGNMFKDSIYGNEFENLPQIGFSSACVETSAPAGDLIKMVEHGFYVEEVSGGHAGDIPAGEYSTGCLLAYEISRGALVSRADHITLSGNVFEDLARIRAVGSVKRTAAMLWKNMGISPDILIGDINVSINEGETENE